MAPSLVITGAKIVELESGSILENTDVWIAHERIVALQPTGSPPPFDGPVERLSFENCLVLPGMVNCHTHSGSALLRGTNPGLPCDLYVMEAMARRAPRDLRHVKISILLQAMEMLKCGITSVIDHFRQGAIPTPEALATVFESYEQAGMRAAVAPMFDDRRYIDSLPLDQSRLPRTVHERWNAMQPPAREDYFAAMAEIVAESRKHQRMQVLLGLEGPPRSTPRSFEMAGEFAARHGIGLHTHLLEVKTQALMATEYSGSLVAYLDRFGLVGPKSSFAHFIWFNERDAELAVDRHLNIVHNPVSNLLFGSGLQPTAKLLAAGLNVALGSDGAGGQPISLFEQAKFAMLLSRISEQDCDKWITARQALRMATINGGRAFGEPAALGAIRVGAHADIAIIKLTSQTYRPMGDIWNHLVMYETGTNVHTVIVGGNVVVYGGRCTNLNEADLLAEADELALQGHAINAPYLENARAERSIFQPLILEALRESMPMERFARLS
jgi:cytosine/adenosine deaminase-related metal-dependent hydrolase